MNEETTTNEEALEETEAVAAPSDETTLGDAESTVETAEEAPGQTGESAEAPDADSGDTGETGTSDPANADSGADADGTDDAPNDSADADDADDAPVDSAETDDAPGAATDDVEEGDGFSAAPDADPEEDAALTADAPETAVSEMEGEDGPDAGDEEADPDTAGMADEPTASAEGDAGDDVPVQSPAEDGASAELPEGSEALGADAEGEAGEAVEAKEEGVADGEDAAEAVEKPDAVEAAAEASVQAAPDAGEAKTAEETAGGLASGLLDGVFGDKQEEEEGDERAWYVVHCYSSYENKVRHNLEQRIESMGMKDRIFDVVVPVEEEIEVREGRRRTIERRVFPGYILVNMILTEDSWYVVRNTPGVTGFVGQGNTPIPLRPEEVQHIVKRMEAETPRIKVTFKRGERVRIIDGPFNDFRGTVSEIDMERAKVRVMVNFFGRETPVELDFLQVEKA